MFVSLAITACFFVFLGVIFGWTSFFQLRQLRTQVNELKSKIDLLQIAPDVVALTQNKESFIAETTDIIVDKPEVKEVESEIIINNDPAPVDAMLQQNTNINTRSNQIVTLFREHWMIVLGGLCIGLSGVFMVKYSIDAGLLGPKARIGMAISAGVIFHLIADWLRRRTGESNPTFAAMAGGASITLYSAFLASLHLYHLLPASLVFTMLAVISLLTMALSLIHGPMLAIVGILGAYIVPILLSDGSGNILGGLLYSLIISGSALLLMRYVYRPWLWLGIVTGALGWWFISLNSHDADNWRGLYLATFAYLAMFVPTGDYSLRGKCSSLEWFDVPSFNILGVKIAPIALALFAVALAALWTIFTQGFNQHALLEWLPLTVILLLSGTAYPCLRYLPWAYLIGQSSCWLGHQVDWNSQQHWHINTLSSALQKPFLIFAGVNSLVYFSHIRLPSRRSDQIPLNTAHLQISLAVIAPLLWLTLTYLFMNGLNSSVGWSIFSMLVGFAYLVAAKSRFEKMKDDVASVWLIFAGHAGYSLAVSMYLREASLTLALAAQLLSLAYLIKRFELSNIHWLFKLILTVIIARLSLNPWLSSYPSDIHWSLWIYGGCTLLMSLSCYLLQKNIDLRKWLEAATLHLLVLTIGAEVRYWLYDGVIFQERFSLAEVAINANLWAGLSLCYLYRARFSESLAKLYGQLSDILLCLAAFAYLIVLTSLNPLFSTEQVSATPVFNLLLLAYGLPVLLCAAIMRFHRFQYRSLAALVLGMGLFIFLTIEIRHLWQGTLKLSSSTSNGELYTYSIIWMLLAVGAVLLAYYKKQLKLYRAGIGLLILVIAKIFLIDMSDLDGLLRVASFMGLGVVLLGLAYLHRLFRFDGDHFPSSNKT